MYKATAGAGASVGGLEAVFVSRVQMCIRDSFCRIFSRLRAMPLLEARKTSRSNSLGVRLTSSPETLTVWLLSLIHI